MKALRARVIVAIGDVWVADQDAALPMAYLIDDGRGVLGLHARSKHFLRVVRLRG